MLRIIVGMVQADSFGRFGVPVGNGQESPVGKSGHEPIFLWLALQADGADEHAREKSVLSMTAHPREVSSLSPPQAIPSSYR